MICSPLRSRLRFASVCRPTVRSSIVRSPSPCGRRGADFELAAGFLFTEGILNDPAQISRIRHCGLPAKDKNIRNTVVVELNEGVDVDFKRLERNFYTTSSCGVCGKSSIEALHTGVVNIAAIDTPKITSEFIHRLPDILRKSQDVFDRTGGLDDRRDLI